jgi:hypothetical protein
MLRQGNILGNIERNASEEVKRLADELFFEHFGKPKVNMDLSQLPK